MFPLREKCPNMGKYGLEKTPYLDTFRTVFWLFQLTAALVGKIYVENKKCCVCFLNYCKIFQYHC